MKNTLTKSEWSVMAVLWENPKQTISGIVEALRGQADWKYNTYVTYLKRMCEKGLVGYEQLGRDKFYYPLVGQRDCILAESESILDKMDSRAAKEFLVCMIKRSELNQNDRKELRQLLDALSKDGE
jgi:BlaI family penicillinase repressor